MIPNFYTWDYQGQLKQYFFYFCIFVWFTNQNILNEMNIGDRNIMFIIVLTLINVIGLLSYNYIRIPKVYDVFNSVMRH